MYFIQLGESSQNVDHTLNVLDLNARGSDHLLDEVLHLDLVLVHALAPHLHPQHVEEDVAEEEDGAGVEIRVERLQHNTRVPRLASPTCPDSPCVPWFQAVSRKLMHSVETMTRQVTMMTVV